MCHFKVICCCILTPCFMIIVNSIHYSCHYTVFFCSWYKRNLHILPFYSNRKLANMYPLGYQLNLTITKLNIIYVGTILQAAYWYVINVHRGDKNWENEKHDKCIHTEYKWSLNKFLSQSASGFVLVEAQVCTCATLIVLYNTDAFCDKYLCKK